MSDIQSGAAQAAPANVTEAQPQPNAQTAKPQSPGQTGAARGQAPSQISEAAQEAMRKFKFKGDDGAEVEVDEAEVLKTYQERKKHQSVASRELNEGRQAKKQAEEFVKMMKDKKTFFEVASKLGHDPRLLAEEFLAEKIQYELMDPKDREILEKSQKLSAYEEKERLAQEAKDNEVKEKLRAHYAKKFEGEFVEALKETAIPQNKDSVARMADYISKAARAKIPMTAKEAAILVQQDLKAIKSSVYKDATAEQLVEMLGEDGLQKLRAYDVSRLKDPMSAVRTPQQQIDSTKPRDRSTGRYTPKQWANVKRGMAPGPK